MTLLLIVFLPLLGALLPLMTERLGRNTCAVFAAIAPLTSLLLLINYLPAILRGEQFFYDREWMPLLGLDLSVRLDGLGMLFGLLILGIGLLVILYARYYLSPRDSLGKLYALLQVFMMAMLGIVMSENILLMIVFWEMTSISSFLLISYWSVLSDARSGARMALTITGAGGLALLAAGLLLGREVGSYALSDILAAGDVIRASANYPLILCLVLFAAFTKSAQFPFHVWLPNAMYAPTPVSAYLHSATMVKAGVFLLARMHPALSDTDLWFYLVTGTGLFTLVFGAYNAMFKHDLKGLLAYSTISHLGLITLLFGLNSEMATIAAIFHIVNHATFKACLFMTAGIIDHETGTRDMLRLNGLWRFMPVTAILSIIAASAMAGVPLLNGFLSKEMFFAETLSLDHSGGWSLLVPIIATLAGIFAVAYSFRFIYEVFFNGTPNDLPKATPHEAPIPMLIPLAILGVLCLGVGILPNLTVAPLLHVAGIAVLGDKMPDYEIALWHGFNAPLLMSIIALVGGLWLYQQRKGLFAFYESRYRSDHKLVFEARIQRSEQQAQKLTNKFEAGSLQVYVVWLTLTVIVLAGWQLFKLTSLQGSLSLTPADPISLVMGFIMIVGALGTVYTHHNRFAALLIISVVGLIVSLIFIRFSAPDLALTQLSVEVVTVVLMMLALYYLPQITPNESSSLRVSRDLLIAGVIGFGVGAIAFAVMTRPYFSISDFYVANSLTGGGGTNIVNVILVDFRGFDTLGEITVLTIGAIGVYAMLHKLRLPTPTLDNQITPWSHESAPVVLVVLARVLLPLALMVSFYIFIRGHNLPGGGFIAGLITSVALILQYISSGNMWVRERINMTYRYVAASGVLLAALTGMASWLFGYPFLTSAFTHLDWPFVGEFEIASAIAFDAGVYLTVVGATLVMLSHLGRLTHVPITAGLLPQKGEK